MRNFGRILRSGAFFAAASIALGLGVASADEIAIGASLPLSGPLAGFGSFQQWGYKRAVDEVNKAGGISIGGTKQMVKLIIRDDKTDPNATASNTETLISRDKVVAMLGSCTPALVNAGALVAERAKKPMVTGCDPLEVFMSVRKWNYVWDIFFSVPELAAAQFKALTDLGVQTNKKIAIWHDNGPDGQAVGGKIWPALAKEFGYEIVQNAEFPVDNTQFTSIIAEAKSKGAEIVLGDAITPQAIAIRKQMAAAGYTPKVLNIEKGAEPVQFAEAPSTSRIPMPPRRSCSTPSRPPARPIPRGSTPPLPRPTRPMWSGRSSSTKIIPPSCRSSRCNGRVARRLSSGPSRPRLVNSCSRFPDLRAQLHARRRHCIEHDRFGHVAGRDARADRPWTLHRPGCHAAR